ncbi:hypothetical protein ACFL2Q_11825 [Thermodesulfobacteriota bacterium]
MKLVDPDKVRLLPGQSMEATFSVGLDEAEEVGLFLRSESGMIRRNGDLGIIQRGGLIRFNDVMLVLTMLRVEAEPDELFDIWWDYHSLSAEKHFQLMSEQERLTVHFYNGEGKDFSVDTENAFRKFFGSLPELLKSTDPWSPAEFERAVRGFCAQSYPKENLWEMIQHGPESKGEGSDTPQADDYPGEIPPELTPFYAYDPQHGHCIRIVPSTFEDEAMKGDVEAYVLPAPVRTVLRGGYRWVKGHPVAAIPFIPGHGLAVPPEDTEL